MSKLSDQAPSLFDAFDATSMFAQSAKIRTVLPQHIDARLQHVGGIPIQLLQAQRALHLHLVQLHLRTQREAQSWLWAHSMLTFARYCSGALQAAGGLVHMLR